MKKQRFFMLGIITVLVAVLSLTFVSSTFAKYTSTVNGNDSARVAKWEWTYEGQDIKTFDDAQFDLFETLVYEVKNDGTIDIASGQDAQVAAGTDAETIIAPGTGGYFTFEFTNNSEVEAQANVVLSATLNGVPIQFSLENTTSAVWGDAASITISEKVEMGATVEVTVYWKWAFTDTVENDLANKTVTVSASTTFTQNN